MLSIKDIILEKYKTNNTNKNTNGVFVGVKWDDESTKNYNINASRNR